MALAHMMTSEPNDAIIVAMIHEFSELHSPTLPRLPGHLTSRYMWGKYFPLYVGTVLIRLVKCLLETRGLGRGMGGHE